MVQPSGERLAEGFHQRDPMQATTSGAGERCPTHLLSTSPIGPEEEKVCK
jgi:hypothetical protein